MTLLPRPAHARSFTSRLSAARCRSARSARALGSGALLAALWCGCAAEFDSASELSGLRVLAVKKSAPYVRPGARVELDLLWHDTDAATRAHPPQIAWLATCENPPGDLFEQCLAQAPELDAENLSRVLLPGPDPNQVNDRFAYATSADLISSRPPPQDPTVPRYGLNYVFFAVCAGEMEFATGRGFPFPCYEELDEEVGFTEGDRRLDSRDFVIGYSAVFGYEDLDNANPIVRGWTVDGITLLPEAADPEPGDDNEVIRLGPADLCIGSACTPPPAEEDPTSCPELLTQPACSDDCRDLEVQPLIDPASAEVDAAASLGRSSVLGEQMWVNYYSAGGTVAEEVRLLNDATLGWNESFGTSYQPAEEARVSYLWAVAHDNRGGAEWTRLRLCTR